MPANQPPIADANTVTVMMKPAWVFDIPHTGHGNAISESGYPILMQLDDMKKEIKGS